MVISLYRLILLICVTVVLGACATTPEFDLESVDKGLQPRAVVESISEHQNKKVLWGGVIISSSNIENATQFEILTYPLNRNLKPKVDDKTTGRIIAIHDSYLETVDYAPGRLLTVVGPVKETKKGQVGEALYNYPVVTTEQLHLWPERESEGLSTRFHIGIGVIFHD